MIPNVLPKSLVDNPRLDQWVRFEADQTIAIATGKVELGQGVLTALAQIAAEELDVGSERLRLVSGMTDQSPDEGYTAGSQSVELSGSSIRLVCAEVRQLLLEEAAGRLQCPVSELAVEDGRFVRRSQHTEHDYWTLAPSVDLSRPATGSIPTKRPSEFRIVGQSLPRVDLAAKVSGAPFIHDLAPEGLLHARILHRPWRGARLISIDERMAGRAAGEVQWIRDGDVLACVAETERAVMLAMEVARRTAKWEGGEPFPDQVSEPTWLMAQPTKDRVIEVGKPVEGEAVSQTIEATYSRPYLAHASIGPSCGLAHYVDGRLTVWTHSQGVFPLRGAIAKVVELGPADITVRHHQGSGCYGHNGADDAALDAAWVAMRHPGRPVRVQWSREDELSASPFGAAMAVRLKADVDAAGRPLVWASEIWSAPHASRPGANGGVNLLVGAALPNPMPVPPAADVPDASGGGGTRNAAVLYDVPYQHIGHHLIPSQPVRVSSLRTLGAFANVFALECFIDELAEAAGQDPIDYRLSLMSDPRARHVIEQTAAMGGGWDKDAELGTGRARGFGFARYKNKAAYCAVMVDIEVEEAVRLLNVWCAVDAGLVINPDGTRNQIEGGIIQGASWTVTEEVKFAEGRVFSETWEHYPILRFSDIPPIEIALIDAPTEAPLGVGEASQGPIAAAIGNAVARALGARIRNLPLSRDRIMSTLLAG